MKVQLLSLLAGTALIASIGVAQASEPMTLSENQMDQVTAGQVSLLIEGPTVTTITAGLVKIEGGNVTVTF